MDTSICKDRYAKKEVLDPHITLEQYGILGEEEVKLFYDFIPINNPLLIWNHNRIIMFILS